MNKDMDVRKTRKADLEELRGLLAATWHDTYDATMGADRVSRITAAWHSPEKLEGELADRQALSLVAEKDGRLLGHALTLSIDEGVVKLARLYVLPAAQGTGAGSALMEAVLAHHAGAAAMELEVEAVNEKARRFYAGRGFEVIRRVDSCGNEDGIPTLIMRRCR